MHDCWDIPTAGNPGPSVYPTNVGHQHVWDTQNHLQPEVSDMHRLHKSKQGQSGWLRMVRQVRSKSTEIDYASYLIKLMSKKNNISHNILHFKRLFTIFFLKKKG
jgi:hypothetical protein